MGIKEKIKEKKRKFDNKVQKGMNDLQYDFNVPDKDNKMRCSKCATRLSILSMVVKARKVKKKEAYKVKCKNCGYINIITKGAE